MLDRPFAEVIEDLVAGDPAGARDIQRLVEIVLVGLGPLIRLAGLEAEGGLAAQRLVKHDTDPPDVGGRSQLAPARLLGRHVVGGPDTGARWAGWPRW